MIVMLAPFLLSQAGPILMSSGYGAPVQHRAIRVGDSLVFRARALDADDIAPAGNASESHWSYAVDRPDYDLIYRSPSHYGEFEGMELRIRPLRPGHYTVNLIAGAKIGGLPTNLLVKPIRFEVLP